jgi:GntR family transcriptional regulator / MocR family aminotransferase
MATLQAGVQERAVVDTARNRSVGLHGIHDYRVSAFDGPARLVLGFGNLSPAAINTGIRTVADLLIAAGAARPA